MLKIKQKDANVIINSLLGGVVPRKGIQHITVGREDESNAIIECIENAKIGNSSVKFWIGDFGAGKSFMLHLSGTIGLKQNFVFSKADFTPEKRLFSNDGKALALYSEIIKNISIQSKPDGQALELILDNWIEELIDELSETLDVETDILLSEKGDEIIQVCKKSIGEIEGVRSYEFKQCLLKYGEAYLKDDEDLKDKCLRWLKGEYSAKTDSRIDLGIREIVNDASYYDLLKLLSSFFTSIGYAGFIINLDEAINLYKISNTSTRAKNYEKLLSIFNDSLQGGSSGIYINIAGTEDFLEDERRGLYSYNALKTRLQTNKFETSKHKDYSQPVIKLVPLSNEEILVLLKKLKIIFEINYECKISLTDKNITMFMEYILNKHISAEMLTPRDIVKDFLNLLNVLRQHPKMKIKDVMGGKNYSKDSSDEIMEV